MAPGTGGARKKPRTRPSGQSFRRAGIVQGLGGSIGPGSSWRSTGVLRRVAAGPSIQRGTVRAEDFDEIARSEARAKDHDIGALESRIERCDRRVADCGDPVLPRYELTEELCHRRPVGSSPRRVERPLFDREVAQRPGVCEVEDMRQADPREVCRAWLTPAVETANAASYSARAVSSLSEKYTQSTSAGLKRPGLPDV